MKLKISDLKSLLNGNKEIPLVENTLNYYFDGKFVPALITENTVIFYAPGAGQYFISEYAVKDDGFEFNQIRKLSFEQEVSEADESQSKFKSYAMGVFEIDENKKSFSDSIKKIKRSIESNEVTINEDVFLDRIKEMGLAKSNFWLSKKEFGQKMAAPNKGEEYKTGDIYTPVSSGNENEFKKNLENCSDALWKELDAKMREKIPGKTIDSFYDMYDVKKLNFSVEDGKGLYKKLDIKFPKDKMWVNENAGFLEKAGIEWPLDKVYNGTIEDVERLLKGKKYVEKEEQCPCEDHLNDLLVSLKGKEIAKESFWKSASFKNEAKALYENEIEVEDFVRKYEPIAWMNEEEITQIFEKTLVDIYNDVNMLSKAKKVGETISFVISE